ncbi:hypothetical protein [Paucibacter sp. XJ19-41]|nr:hypothetical protein [Paucibacter sp. XJ19-41]MDC6170894.1 hypothetical protein [Paucibacter sp. XJ19-41]
MDNLQEQQARREGGLALARNVALVLIGGLTAMLLLVVAVVLLVWF